MNLSG